MNSQRRRFGWTRTAVFETTPPPPRRTSSLTGACPDPWPHKPMPYCLFEQRNVNRSGSPELANGWCSGSGWLRPSL